jgi:hypothetical protein
LGNVLVITLNPHCLKTLRIGAALFDVCVTVVPVVRQMADPIEHTLLRNFLRKVFKVGFVEQSFVLFLGLRHIFERLGFENRDLRCISGP